MTIENPPPASPYAQPNGATPYGGSPYSAGQPLPPRGLSIASMVCGITGVVLSMFLVGFLPALAGVILGHMGRKKEPFGRGFSLAGLITGYVGIGLSALVGLMTLAAILIPLLIVGSMGTAAYSGVGF